ncbi:uncharacterized protein [Palaemon carinicauda]|uniref:uncharacterized protein n=1 Tax=Palaemon carinicauda TaxID=392227 RepID=UPI0035B583E9
MKIWMSGGNRRSSILKRVGREVFGMSTEKGPRDKETCWWSNYVQKKIKIKRNAKKRYDETGTEEDKERSRLAKKEAKVSVAQSKQQALDGNLNLGMVRDIDREEIKVDLIKMKNGKATRPDEIPVEVWKCLGEFGVDMLRIGGEAGEMERGIGDQRAKDQ